MKIFVTGATGFVGSAIVRELTDAGHRVLGLARNDAAADKLKQQGIDVHRGDVTDAASLAAGARASDAVIHTAFNHDFSKWAEHCEDDRHAIEALGGALAGSNRPLIVTSGTGLVATPGRPAAENDAPTSALPRIASEQAADALRARGVHISVVRLPPSVHGDGDHGFVPTLIGIARDKHASAYVNEGNNRWSAVHRLDAAHLYRLVIEKGSAGARYHGVGDEGVPFRDIAGAIGRRLGVPIVSKTSDEAAEHFGWFSHFAALDAPASSEKTQRELGWRPTHVGLIADLEHGTYF
ncbi:MAG TPA: SDR family oxidoreductase [Gemmatimonadaceae bacterium]|nr:SDR family oxidoreductase [Gemmatimonadaceae bacterium]